MPVQFPFVALSLLLIMNQHEPYWSTISVQKYLSNRRRFQTEHGVLLRLDEIVVGGSEDVRVIRRLLGGCKERVIFDLWETDLWSLISSRNIQYENKLTFGSARQADTVWVQSAKMQSFPFPSDRSFGNSLGHGETRPSQAGAGLRLGLKFLVSLFLFSLFFLKVKKKKSWPTPVFATAVRYMSVARCLNR